MRKNLIGKTFHRLTILANLPSFKYTKTGKSHRAVLCSCICGNVLQVRLDAVELGTTMSCGCATTDARRKLGLSKRTHGDTANRKRTTEYTTWERMKSRCHDKNNNRYRHYGGRGIKVCKRWLGRTGYLHFISDMGRKPGPEYSIDRINNDGDYKPSNCRWATSKQQANNKSNNVVKEKI